MADLDSLGYQGLGSFDPTFDLDGDGQVGESDIYEWLKLAGEWSLPSGIEYLRSDVDLSGENTIEDYEILLSNLGTSASSFSAGDLDFSEMVDGADRDLYVAEGGVVPEPGTLTLVGSGLTALAWLMSRRCRD